MKRVVALLLSGVMISSLVFCGCTPKETEETVQSGSQEETTEAGFEAPVNTLNEKKLKKAQEYCASVDPEGDEGVPVYIEGIRGAGSTIVDDNLVYFNYSSLDGDSFGINVKRDTGEVSFSISSIYRDESYAANASFYLGEFEEFFDKVCEDPASIDPYTTSALNTNLEDIKHDFPIIFARMIAYSDIALSEVGLGLKDLGIDLGDKYRNIDPKQMTSKEVEITNEHKFENGFCTDCGETWSKYYYEVVKRIQKPVVSTGEYLIIGQGSSSMISPVDQVKYSAHSDSWGNLYYQHLDIDNDKGIKKTDWCNIIVNTYNDNMELEIQYQYAQQKFSTGGAQYSYYVIVSPKPGEVDKVFESKEVFKKNAKVMLSIFPKEHEVSESNAFATMKEEEIRQLMEADGLTFLTEDEIIDRFWDYHVNFFTSLENGMIWMKLSLKDIGFNWK